MFGPGDIPVQTGQPVLSDDAMTVTVTLEGEIPDGTYVVSYRVQSSDTHPVRGAIVFSVGPGSPVDDVDLDAILGSGDRWWELAAVVARWVIYTGTLIASGGAWLATALRKAPDRRTVAVIRVGAIAGMLSALLSIPIQAALATGTGFRALFDSAVVSAVLGDGVGLATALSVVGLALVGLSSGRRAPRITGFVGGAMACVALVLTGHNRSTSPVALVTAADLLHVLAAATWSGGLLAALLLWQERRRLDDPAGAADIVDRFSMIAGFALVAAVVAGGLLAWVEVRAWRALTATAYGWTLAVKLALVAAILSLAVYNRFRLVPAVRASVDSATWKQLRLTMRFEVGLVVLVLAVTAVLVNLTPAASEAGISGYYSATVPIGDGEVNVVVDPNRAGDQNEVHLYFFDENGRVDEGVSAVELLFSLPSRDLGPISREPFDAGSGHYLLAGVDLPIPGDWEVEVITRPSQFEDERATLRVPVGK
ncbi:MAG: Copper transport protein YcnJ [Acidimicrobiales bacterium]|nr:Copper transport protein YcnJ [Acidimicrobiales bacterium]